MTYRAPMSWRPPLAFGGHGWLLDLDDFATCGGCFVTVPDWALREGFWMPMAGRWCPATIRAIGPARHDNLVATG